MGSYRPGDIRPAKSYLEQTKTDREREQSQNEVDAFETRLRQLLTVHHSVGPQWDWSAIASILRPPKPIRTAWNESRARQMLELVPSNEKPAFQNQVDEARLTDDAVYRKSTATYSDAVAQLEKYGALARRILSGEEKAFTEVVLEVNPFADLAGLGTDIHLIVHSPTLVECSIRVNGTKIFPEEMKTLTAKGKVSTKRMAKGRLHELYQDYVSSCLLRVGRELFALLPIRTVLLTAVLRSEEVGEQPVLSVAISRHELENIDFTLIDPFAVIDQLQHRGDFKTSRKTQAFLPIAPLQPSDINLKSNDHSPISFETLVRSITQLRQELQKETATLLSQQAFNSESHISS